MVICCVLFLIELLFLDICSLIHVLLQFSKSIELAKVVNCFRYLITNSRFRTGQSSSLDVWAISFSLSLPSISQSYRRWSVVWSPCLQEHSGDWIILKLCRYALVFPCAVSNTVRFGDSLSYTFSLSVTLGKYSLVARPFVLASHCICHFAIVFSASCLAISLIGILL